MERVWRGRLVKMGVCHETPVAYSLRATDPTIAELPLNPLLGSSLRIETDGTIECIHCGRRTKKAYGEGSCYPCFQRLPQNDICIVKPELCHFHAEGNPCRDPEWGKRHCFSDHLLYVAVSSGVKVGITRVANVPTRWMDQGASVAMPIALLPDRLSVGLLEKHLSQHFSDRTQWQRMLKNEVPRIDLESAIREVLAQVPAENAGNVIGDRKLYTFEYPALEWPKTVRSLKLLKTPVIEGRLLAIKGQYLSLDCGVFNVRAHSGWEITLSRL